MIDEFTCTLKVIMIYNYNVNYKLKPIVPLSKFGKNAQIRAEKKIQLFTPKFTMLSRNTSMNIGEGELLHLGAVLMPLHANVLSECSGNAGRYQVKFPQFCLTGNDGGTGCVRLLFRHCLCLKIQSHFLAQI